jgi:sugar lactone lactonase YvrE
MVCLFALSVLFSLGIQACQKNTSPASPFAYTPTPVLGPFIITFAGTLNTDKLGDGGPATLASINPFGINFDSLGNLYIADIGNVRIRKVNTNGIISSVAGNGVTGYLGDGGIATSAELSNPRGVAADSLGNIYIADSDNYRVRMVNLSGSITTVAGTGVTGYTGDGGPAILAKLNRPYALAVDNANNLYIADQFNDVIRKVDNSGTISTIAGGGTAGLGDGGPATAAQLSDPNGLAFDSSYNLYISDSGNSRIRKVNKTNGLITTVTGTVSGYFMGDGGPAIDAVINAPTGVALDSLGNMFIAEGGDARIRKVDMHGIITTIAGDGTEGDTGLPGQAILSRIDNVEDIAVDSKGNVYFSDGGWIREIILH